jgi:hypothetical protein
MKVTYKTSMLVALSIMLTACQSTNDKAEHITPVKIEVSYSDYYLWLKSLSSVELLIEIKQQKKQLSSTEKNDEDTLQQESKLLLIYSLPNPVVYQPYKAKVLLNKYPLPDNVSNKSDKNLAFMVMLRDQLNSQLHLLSKQTKIESLHLDEQAKKNAEILHLKKQLTQLKAIEKNISGHALTNEH